MGQSFLKKKNNLGGLALLNIKTYHKAAIIKPGRIYRSVEQNK